MGSVTAHLRIFKNSTHSHSNFSPTVARGKADFLIALEPWEGLRLLHFLKNEGMILLNSEVTSMVSERMGSYELDDPVKKIKSLGFKQKIKNYSELATVDLGSKKMMNYLLGKDCAKELFHSDIAECFDDAFRIVVPKAEWMGKNK